MHNLSKIAFVGSVVLGAALFSIGCGGDSACCDGTTNNPPVAKIKDLTANKQVTYPADKSTLVLNGLGSTDDIGVKKYEWTVVNCSQNFEDGSVLSTNPNYTVNLTQEYQRVCLRVTDDNGKTDTTCSCVRKEKKAVIPCNAPTAKLNLTDSSGNVINGNLTRSPSSDNLIQYNLNCADSASNCANAGSTGNLTCEWSASSYFVDGTDCNVPDSQRTAYISDCFKKIDGKRGDNDFGLKTTTPDSSTFFKICSASASKFKCIKIDLTVKDNMGNNTKSKQTSKIFPVNP